MNKFGYLPFNLPITITGVILWAIALVGGVILLWDSLSMESMGIGQQLKLLSIIGGLLLLAVGIIPILHSFGIIPFNIPEGTDMIKSVLFIIFGLLLLYGGMQGY